MKKRTLQFLAKRLGKELHEDHFEYWDEVLHIGETAICFYQVNNIGTYTVITDPELFPRFCTAAYILRAITNGAENLGVNYNPSIAKLLKTREWARFDEPRKIA